jgi:radical SAM superfamily enzyme YgiQ (UPF0313 family)
MKIVLVTLFDEFCLGVRYISATLRRAGHETAIIHLRRMEDINRFPDHAGDGDYLVPPAYVSARELELFQETLAQLKPDLIGFSLTSNFVALAEHLTRLVRSLGARIVWGGIDMLADPERALRSADVICRGEGEGPMLDLVAALEQGRDWRDIANLWVRDGDRIVRNDPRPPCLDLDEIPYPDHDLSHAFSIYDNRVATGRYPEGSQLNYYYVIITARGCPYHCTYCCSPAIRSYYEGHRYYRRRRVETVIDELKRQKQARGDSLGFIGIHDDVFTINPSWIAEFATAYKREIGLRFWCYTFPTVTRRDMMERLKDAGLDYVIIGLQSGSQRVLNEVFHRRTPREAICDAMKILTDLGIKVIIDLIGSNPFETEADRAETFELLLSLPRPYAIHTVNPLTLYKGSEILEMARREPAVWAELEEYNNDFLAKPKPIYDFWNALHELCQYDCFGREELEAFTHNEYLRGHPDLLQMLVRLLKPLYYYDSNLSAAKDRYIRELQDRIFALEHPSVRQLLSQAARKVRSRRRR